MPRADDRFWASTRGRLLTFLRKGPHSVAELASALGLTSNAIRAHLATLERDGLVRTSGIRRGARKPAATYVLAPKAEQLFPKAHARVLGHLLAALRESLTSRQVEAVIQTAAHDVARTLFPPGAPVRHRPPAEAGVAVLTELGGYCEVTRKNGTLHLGCVDCPLATDANGHPELCRLTETVLADVLGVPVRQHCRTAPPQCHFEIAASGDSV